MIALAHALVNGFPEVPTNYMHLLSQFHKNYREAGVLADGNILFPGNPGVFQKLGQNISAGGRDFLVAVNPPGLRDIRSQMSVGADGQVPYCSSDLPGRNFSHPRLYC